jgi:hypothetical protein
MLLDVKQKSESDADILLSFDQSNCRVGPNRCWLACSNLLRPLDSVSERHIGLNRRGGPSDRFCCGSGTDLLVRPYHL